MDQLPHGEGLQYLVFSVFVFVTDSLTMKPSGWQLSPCEELHERHQGQRDLHRAALPGDYVTPLFAFLINFIFAYCKIYLQIAPADLGVDKSAMEKRLLGERAEV